jgi:predicted MFS family arabinose efflux permease
MTDVTRRAAPALLVVGLAAACTAVGHGFGRLSYPFVLPAMVDDVLGTYSRAGLLGMANVGAYLAGLLVMIRFSGRVGLVGFLRIGLTGVTAGLALMSVAPNFAVLCLAMVLAGGFNAAIWVPASALVASAVSERHRGLASGALGAGYGLAIVFAGQLTRGVAGARGPDTWRPVWAVMAVLGAVVLAAVLLRLPADAGQRRSVPGLGMGALRRLPGSRALVVTYAAFALGYVVYTSYLVAALSDGAGFSPGHAASAYSVLGVTGIVGGLLVGRLSDVFGRRRVLLGAHLLMAICALAVLLGAEPWVTLSAAVFGIFASGLPAAIAAYVADHLEPLDVARAFGIVTLAFGILQTVGPPLGGFLVDLTGGFTATFLLAAGAHAAGALAAALLPRSSRIGGAVPQQA